jgi:hypothetical protein
VLADVSPQCRNRDTEMQRHSCAQLFVRTVGVGDGQAAEKGLRKRAFRVRVEDHPAGASDG